jgi:hypothetical protein
MKRRRIFIFLLVSMMIPRLQDTCQGQAAKPIDFAHDVVPVLKTHCVRCHGGKESKGGFSLNTRALLLEADVLQLGKAGDSRLFELITSNDPEEQMPPRDRKRLSAIEQSVLQRWINENLPWESGFTFSENRYEPPLLPRRPRLPPPQAGRMNPIDRILDAYLAERKIPRTAVTSDREFIRRAYLDLIGLLPERKAIDRFLANADSEKRTELVAQLLGQSAPAEHSSFDYRIAYTEHWLTFWNDLLRNDYGGTGFITGGRKQISKWLYDALLTNKPYDKFVRELVAPTTESEGFIRGIRWRGNVNSSQTVEIQFAQNITQAFLGINMKCASCHDSFIDHWTLAETYNLAAVFSDHPLQLHRCGKPLGIIATPAWIFPECGQIDAKAPRQERLEQLAALMTHPENGRLTRTIVNRFWHQLMGRGIAHPVDAMHTEPWSVDLLDFLASDLADHGYDLQRTLTLICTSQAYQSQTSLLEQSTEGAEYVYRGPLAKRMTAEQFVDAVWQITGTAPLKFDAPVVRISGTASVDARRDVPMITSRWIWSVVNARDAKAGEQRTFRRTFTLERLPRRAVAAITCDNEYTVFVNGKLAGKDSDWTTIETIDIRRLLKLGENELLIVGRNAGSRPNAAGLIFELRLVDGEQAARTIGTDTGWQWTAAAANNRGKFGKSPEWKAAAEVDHADIWQSQIGPQMSAILAHADQAPLMMARASLLKADALMRALGRPNRDQIVTSRPKSLTTLEAIDLANGEKLAAALERGGRFWLETQPDPDTLVNEIFQATLARDPNAGERRLALEMFGQSTTSQSVADLIWSIFMLPEFQFIR